MTGPAPTNRPQARQRSRWARLLCSAAAVAAGCCHGPPPAPPPQGYVGPTDPIGVVVQRVNRNAERVPSVWSQLDYTATLVDPGRKQTTRLSGDGVLQFRRPASLVLTGYKDVAGQVFQLGCNGDSFWVKVRTAADASDYYYGTLAHVGSPGTRPVPVRPDLVVEVLGVGLLRPDLLAEPVPVMRFDNEAGCYVFDFNVRRPDRWVTQKEVWYDHADCLPRRVLLYDDAGRVVVRAELSRHQPLEVPTVPAADWPRVARHYDLRFPDTGSAMSLDLNDPALAHRVKRVTLPNDHSFAPPQPDGNDRVIPVDAGATSG